MIRPRGLTARMEMTEAAEFMMRLGGRVQKPAAQSCARKRSQKTETGTSFSAAPYRLRRMLHVPPLQSGNSRFTKQHGGRGLSYAEENPKSHQSTSRPCWPSCPVSPTLPAELSLPAVSPLRAVTKLPAFIKPLKKCKITKKKFHCYSSVYKGVPEYLVFC